MPAPMLARLRPCLLPLALAALVSGCSSGEDFPPPCPAVSILHDAADLNRFNGAGGGLTDSVLSGRITGLSGTCKRAPHETVLTTVSVALDLARGPAAKGRVAEAAYFVALTHGQTILAKQVLPLHAAFPPNTDHLRLVGDQVEVRVPNTAKTPASAYQVLVGFELTPAELAVNRARGVR